MTNIAQKFKDSFKTNKVFRKRVTVVALIVLSITVTAVYINISITGFLYISFLEKSENSRIKSNSKNPPIGGFFYEQGIFSNLQSL